MPAQEETLKINEQTIGKDLVNENAQKEYKKFAKALDNVKDETDKDIKAKERAEAFNKYAEDVLN